MAAWLKLTGFYLSWKLNSKFCFKKRKRERNKAWQEPIKVKTVNLDYHIQLYYKKESEVALENYGHKYTKNNVVTLNSNFRIIRQSQNYGETTPAPNFAAGVELQRDSKTQDAKLLHCEFFRRPNCTFVVVFKGREQNSQKLFSLAGLQL